MQSGSSAIWTVQCSYYLWAAHGASVVWTTLRRCSCLYWRHIGTWKNIYPISALYFFALAPHKCTLLRPKVRYLGHLIGGWGNLYRLKQGSSCPYVALSNLHLSTEKFPETLFLLQTIHSLLCRRSKTSTQAVWSWPNIQLDVRDWSCFPSAETDVNRSGYLVTDAPFILDTDASNSAVLSQWQEDRERVIAYYSRTPQPAWKAATHFHAYLHGRHLLQCGPSMLLSNSYSALKIQKVKWPGGFRGWLWNPTLTRNNADALSRCPCLPQHCKHCDRLESKEAAHIRKVLQKKQRIFRSGLLSGFHILAGICCCNCCCQSPYENKHFFSYMPHQLPLIWV